MTVSRGRQPSGKTSAMSGGIYVALLTALLLLSPHTARAVAQVLTQNGVALPAHVVRVLDALPVEPTRDAPRREGDEGATFAAPTADTTDEPAPETAAVCAVTSTAAPLPLLYPLPHQKERRGVSERTRRFDLPRDSSPRAPPV